MTGVAIACCLLAGCGPVETTGTSRAQIIGGALDTGDPAVVALYQRGIRCGDLDRAPLCTGTLIAPRVVLTAAHCLDAQGPDGEYEVAFGASLSDPAHRFIVVSSAAVNPAYVAATHEGDLALLLLAEASSVTPVPLGIFGTADLGAQVRAVGFGISATGGATGPKRTGTMQVASVQSAAFTAAPAPEMTCVGDSGGPVLLDRGSGEELVGVTASGDFACASESFNVRPDAFASFIDPFVAAATTAPPGWPAQAPSLGELCTAPCTSRADCPAGLECLTDAEGLRRCGLAALQHGTFDEACTTDAQCGAGGTCARVWPEDCRCFHDCSVETVGGGCAAIGGALVPPALLLLAAMRRRRSLRDRRH